MVLWTLSFRKIVNKLEFAFGRIKSVETGEFIPKYDFHKCYEIVRDARSQKDYKYCSECKGDIIIIEKGE